MRKHRWQPWVAGIGALMVCGLLMTRQGQTQSYGNGGGGNAAGQFAQGTQVAVSTNVDNHVHSIALSNVDIANFIGGLQNDTDTIQIQSSSGFDGGTLNGPIHEHAVLLSRQQLQQLQNTGFLTVQSEETLGHTHIFVFIPQTQCPPIQRMPIPTPSVSPSPSASPSPSPSASPSPSPSISPRPSPSVSPSVSPRPSPSVSPSISPRPSPTMSPGGSPNPRPSVSVTVTPTITATVTAGGTSDESNGT